MRKRSSGQTTSVLMKLAGNTVMGVAMGLLFVFALNVPDQSGIARLIDHGADQGTTVLVFVGTIVTTGIGATLTGLILIMMEDN